MRDTGRTPTEAVSPVRLNNGRGNQEQGQIMILFALAMVMIIGFSALVIDLGFLRTKNETLWNAADAGALAAGSLMPVTGAAAGAAATARAVQYTVLNYPGLPAGNVTTSFSCIVGDRDGSTPGTGDGHPDAVDVPFVCDPGLALNDPAWHCDNLRCSAPCNPAAGNKCNSISVSATATVPYALGPALGINTGTAKAIGAVACKGLCGSSPATPVDVVLIVDRTTSMSSAQITNMKNAANTILRTYDPNFQYVGLGIIGPSSTNSTCSGANSPGLGIASTGTGEATITWLPVGLTGGNLAPDPTPYRNADGTVNTNSTLAKTIACATQNNGSPSWGTNLETPVDVAAGYVRAAGRPGSIKGIILMTDGEPNQSSTAADPNKCNAANSAANRAKNPVGFPRPEKIIVYTIGFFDVGQVNGPNCPDTSGAFLGKTAADVLASMANTSVNNGCVPAENLDGDNFFCQPKSEDLASVFRLAAASLAAGSRLVTIP